MGFCLPQTCVRTQNHPTALSANHEHEPNVQITEQKYPSLRDRPSWYKQDKFYHLFPQECKEKHSEPEVWTPHCHLPATRSTEVHTDENYPSFIEASGRRRTSTSQRITLSDAHLEQTGHHSSSVPARFVLYVRAELDRLPHNVPFQIRRGGQDNVATFHKLVVEFLGDRHSVGLLQDSRETEMLARESHRASRKTF